MNKERIAWLDLVKGIGICAVILGHMSIPYELGKFIFSFHMPLFFFISGYLTKDVDWGRFLRSKGDHLVIPYFVYAIPLGLIAMSAGGFEAKRVWLNVLKGNGVYTSWFLSALLSSSIIGLVCVKYLRKWWMMIVALPVIAVVGLYCPLFAHQYFLSCQAWCPGTVFFLTGYLFAKVGIIDWVAKGNVTRKMIVLSVLGAMGFTYLFNIRVSMSECKLGNPFIYYVSAVGMTGLIFTLCSSLKFKLPLLEYMGNKSLQFMMWHAVLPTLMSVAFAYCGLDANASSSIKLLSRILNLSLMFAIVWLLDRYVPIFSGKVRVFSR